VSASTGSDVMNDINWSIQSVSPRNDQTSGPYSTGYLKQEIFYEQ
jgi:hypothetical protein